jgi:hypothetical protein
MGMHSFVVLLLMTMPGVLALISLSVCMGISHRMVISSFSVTVSGGFVPLVGCIDLVFPADLPVQVGC